MDLDKLCFALRVELFQPPGGLFIPRIDDQDPLQAVDLAIGVVHHLAQPQPGRDVAAVLGHDAGQQVSRPLAIAELGGFDAIAEQRI